MTQDDHDSGPVLRIQWLNPGNETADTEWEFPAATVVRIGRSRESHIQIDEEQISRTHVTIYHDGEDFICRAVGRNGCLSDGNSFTSLTVNDGTTIELGRTGPALRFSFGGREEDFSGTITQWIGRIAGSGCDEAQVRLWDTYFEQVVRLARNRLSDNFRRVADEEDIAVSVFKSFYEGAAKGRFPDLSNRENVWRILAVMTARKVADHVQAQRRLKRGGGEVRGESVFNSDYGNRGLEQFGCEDAPEFALRMAEEAEIMVSKLDDSLQPIARLALEGHSSQEIAEQTGLNLRAVQRRLKQVRLEWSHLLDSEISDRVMDE